MKNIAEMIQAREKRSELIHELSFYVSLAFSVLFFWMLGGNSILWCILFALSGVVIDYVKKTQLDIAAVTARRRTRLKHKTVALVMTLFSLLAGLGASLLRAQTVANLEIAATDTTSIDKKIAMSEAEYQVQLNQVNTSTRKEWRDNAQAKADATKADLDSLLAEKDKIKSAAVGKERTADMFTLLADFFGFGNNAGRFMVILLMLAQGATELSIWVTTPQYWRVPVKAEKKTTERAERKPRKRYRRKMAKSAPVLESQSPAVAKSRPDIASESPMVVVSSSKPEKIAPRPNFAIPGLSEKRAAIPERVLRVENRVKAKKILPVNGELFGGENG